MVVKAQVIMCALNTWRDGEQLLEALSPASPDRERVVDAVAAARGAYHALTRPSPHTPDELAEARAEIAAVREVLETMRARNT